MSERKKQANTRNPKVILHHRQQIAELYLKGLTHRDIAARVGVTPSIVKDDLEVIRRWWHERAVDAFDAKKAEEAAKLDRIEAEAWEAWEKSKLPKRRSETLRSRGGGFQGSDYSETTASFEESPGDPRYLMAALKAVDRRCKLFGLDEPDKSVVMSLELIKVYEGVDLDKV